MLVRSRRPAQSVRLLWFWPAVFIAVLLAPTWPPAARTAQANQADGGEETGDATGRPLPEISVVGQVGGVVRAVAAEGRYAYVGVGPRVVALDTADPANPQTVGRSPILRGR